MNRPYSRWGPGLKLTLVPRVTPLKDSGVWPGGISVVFFFPKKMLPVGVRL